MSDFLDGWYIILLNVEIEFMEEKHNKKNGEGHGVHPEYHWLRKLNHEGILSVRIENQTYMADSDDAKLRREEFAGLLMYNLRQKWKHGKLDCYWWGCSEFGQSGNGHFHIIFSFDYMRRNFKATPSLEGFEDSAKESAEHIRKQLSLPAGCIDLDWEPVNENDGLVRYFCKVEWGREDYKHFFPFATGGQMAEWLFDEIQPEISDENGEESNK